LECGNLELLEETISKASWFGAAIFGTNNWYALEAERIAELVIERKLVAIGFSERFTDSGLLMSYGADVQAVARSVAPLVKKILEGEKT
jgi:hypothetical protein